MNVWAGVNFKEDIWDHCKQEIHHASGLETFVAENWVLSVLEIPGRHPVIHTSNEALTVLLKFQMVNPRSTVLGVIPRITAGIIIS